MKVVAVSLKNSLWSWNPPESCHACACCWSVGNHNHFRERKWHSSFLEWRRFGQWKLSWLGWDFEYGTVEGQLLFKETGISEAWRGAGEKTLDMWANFVLKHCLSLKIFIRNFVAFFVLLAIVISCIHKMSFSVTSEKREQIYQASRIWREVHAFWLNHASRPHFWKSTIFTHFLASVPAFIQNFAQYPKLLTFGLYFTSK